MPRSGRVVWYDMMLVEYILCSTVPPALALGTNLPPPPPLCYRSQLPNFFAEDGVQYPSERLFIGGRDRSPAVSFRLLEHLIRSCRTYQFSGQGGGGDTPLSYVSGRHHPLFEDSSLDFGTAHPPLPVYSQHLDSL